MNDQDTRSFWWAVPILLVGALFIALIVIDDASSHTSEIWQPPAGGQQYLGHEHRDIIHGSDAYTGLSASGGNDLAYGQGGNDDLRGGDGDDDLYGNGGEDELRGGNGVDLLVGGSGWDTCWGGGGADVFSGCEVTNL